MERKVLIFVASRIRTGVFPRIPNFAFSEEQGKYLYLGRPLSLDEFNAAAEAVLDAHEGRFSLSVRLIPAKSGGEKDIPTLLEEAPPKASKRRKRKDDLGEKC